MSGPIAPCLWFDNNAEEAVSFYTSIFKDSKVLHVDRYGGLLSGSEFQPENEMVFIEFQINGQAFQALNGGPMFQFSEAISLVVDCEDQTELDYYWNALLAGGGEESQCGWLKDRFGVSWQIVPTVFYDMVRSEDRVRAGQAMRRMLEMVKLDIAELQAAFDQ